MRSFPHWLLTLTLTQTQLLAPVSIRMHRALILLTFMVVLATTSAAAQSGGDCTYQLSPPRQIVPQAGGWVFVEVITQGSCPWSVRPFNQSDWVDAGYYGVRVGPGWITIHAAPNSTSSPRTRRFEVGGQQFWVWQPGATNGPWFDAWYPVEQQQKPLGLVLQHNTAKSFSYWTVDPRAGTLVRRSTPDYTLDNSWQVVGSGDFNIDGQSDILFRHGDGRMVVWLMQDAVLLDSVSMGWVDPDWRLASVADMDRDGRVDLIWHHRDGRVAVWLMEGTTPRAGLLIAAPLVPDWWLRTSGDFNGDGWVDLIWQHVNGRVAVWFMRETQMLSGEVFAILSPTGGWTLRGAGDMDGDGWPDLLWQQEDGLPPYDGRRLAVWYMHGLVMTQGVSFVIEAPGPFRLAAPK